MRRFCLYTGVPDLIRTGDLQLRRNFTNSDYLLISLINGFINKLAEMAKKEATDCLGKVLYQAELNMKCGYSRSDN